MKKIYETPQIIVTAFEGENIMQLSTVTNTAAANAQKSTKNTMSFGQLQ